MAAPPGKDASRPQADWRPTLPLVYDAHLDFHQDTHHYPRQELVMSYHHILLGFGG
jgi:hypothetical protein